jgi:hypothetical protein
MKVYAFPIFDYLCYDGKLLVTGALYNEEGKFLVSANGIGLEGFKERVKEMCKVRNYEFEYCKQAPQWLIRKIMEVRDEQ